MKKKSEITDIKECAFQIQSLLKEYNCEIVMDGVHLILIDKDTNMFEYIDSCDNE